MILGSRKAPEKRKSGMSDEDRQDGRIAKKFYERELFRLQEELVDLQEWIKQEGLRVAVIFVGRDASGKGASSSGSPSD